MYKFQYCLNCGELFEKVSEKLYLCPKCGFKFYTNVVVSTGAIIVNRQKQVLLTVRANDPGKGLWEIPGGFLNPGETAVQALSREVMEEVGLSINNFNYFGTFPSIYRHQDIDYNILQIVYSTDFPVGARIKLTDEVLDYTFFDFDKIPLDKIGNRDNEQALRQLVRVGL